MSSDKELAAFAERARKARDDWRRAWRHTDKSKSTWRHASWPERFVRNYLDYRRTLPRAGRSAAVRWALEDPVQPYLVKK